MKKILNWLKLIFSRDYTEYRTIDGGFLAPYPNMTDEELQDFERDMGLPSSFSENGKIIEAVEKYQRNESFHPLTCGNDSSHELLKAVERNGRVVLICEDCDYVQQWIPQLPNQSWPDLN